MQPVRPSPILALQPVSPDPFLFPATPAVADGCPVVSNRRRLCELAYLGSVVVMLTCCSAGAESLSKHVPSAAVAVDTYAGFIVEASQRFGIPASWIRAVMQAESGGDLHAVSPKGAIGLMQIMPATWADLRARYGLGADPFNTHDNIMAGAAYLRELHDRYGSPGFLAAYNAGPERYEEHLATGRPLPDETITYVAALSPRIGGDAVDGGVMIAAAAPSWIDAPLFAVRGDSKSAASRQSFDEQSGKHSFSSATVDRTAFAPRSSGLFAAISSRSSHL